MRLSAAPELAFLHPVLGTRRSSDGTSYNTGRLELLRHIKSNVLSQIARLLSKGGPMLRNFRIRAARRMMELSRALNAKAESRLNFGALPGRVLAKAALNAPERDPEMLSVYDGLPDDYKIPEMTPIRDFVEANYAEVMEGNLWIQDYARIGALTQVGASIEQLGHQMRYRLIRAGVLQDNVLESRNRRTLFSHVEKGVKRLNVEEGEKSELLALITLSNDHLGIRDLVAHFIGRPIEGHNSLMFVTLRETDALTLTGRAHDPESNHYAILRRTDLDRALEELARINERLHHTLESWQDRPISSLDTFDIVAPKPRSS